MVTDQELGSFLQGLCSDALSTVFLYYIILCTDGFKEGLWRGTLSFYVEYILYIDSRLDSRTVNTK